MKIRNINLAESRIKHQSPNDARKVKNTSGFRAKPNKPHKIADLMGKNPLFKKDRSKHASTEGHPAHTEVNDSGSANFSNDPHIEHFIKESTKTHVSYLISELENTKSLSVKESCLSELKGILELIRKETFLSDDDYQFLNTVAADSEINHTVLSCKIESHSVHNTSGNYKNADSSDSIFKSVQYDNKTLTFDQVYCDNNEPKKNPFSVRSNNPETGKPVTLMFVNKNQSTHVLGKIDTQISIYEEKCASGRIRSDKNDMTLQVLESEDYYIVVKSSKSPFRI